MLPQASATLRATLGHEKSPGLPQASQFYLLKMGLVCCLRRSRCWNLPPAPARPPHLPVAPGGSPAPLPPAAARTARTRSPSRGPPPRSRRARCPSCSGSRRPAPRPCQGQSTRVTRQPSAPCPGRSCEGGCLHPPKNDPEMGYELPPSTKGIITLVLIN